jgi:hypothetical protein
MDVILSYYFLAEYSRRDTEKTQTHSTEEAEIASSFFWMIASSLTIFLSIRLGKQGFEGVSNDTDGGLPRIEVTSGSMA